jgi:hypothetical protein
MITKRWALRCAVSSSIVLAGLAIGARRGAADAPAGQYTIADGTVTDSKTGLVWQQVVPSSTYTWADAGTYCTSNAAGLPGTGWRVPSLTEIQTIVDDSRHDPAIDPTAFPGTPLDAFWTSSLLSPASAQSAWLLGSGNGGTGTNAVTFAGRVRCVR